MSVKTFFQKRSVRVGAVIVAVTLVGVIGMMKQSSVRGSVTATSRAVNGAVERCVYTAAPVTKISTTATGYKSEYALYYTVEGYKIFSVQGVKKESRHFGLDADGGANAIQKTIDGVAVRLAREKGYTWTMRSNGPVQCTRVNTAPEVSLLTDIEQRVSIEIENSSTRRTLNDSSVMNAQPGEVIHYTVDVKNNGPDRAERVTIELPFDFNIRPENVSYGSIHRVYPPLVDTDQCDPIEPTSSKIKCVTSLGSAESRSYHLQFEIPSNIAKRDCGKVVSISKNIISTFPTLDPLRSEMNQSSPVRINIICPEDNDFPVVE